MNILIDTHIFLWWLEDSPKLTTIAKEHIQNPQNVIWISVASVWEISLKRAKGSLHMEREVSELLRRRKISC